MPDVKMYCIVSHNRENLNTEDLQAVIPEHLAFAENMERDGTIVLAGPLLDAYGEQSTTGMTVIRASNRAAAAQYAEKEPFHAQGVRTYSIHEWRIDQASPPNQHFRTAR